jgi:hypothetical protein
VGKQLKFSNAKQSSKSVPFCCRLRVGLLLGGLGSVSRVGSGSRQAPRFKLMIVGGALSVVRIGERITEGMD